MPNQRLILSPARFDAAIFDLDGVVTRAAELHGKAWRKTFNNFLMENAARTGRRYEPFDIASDYPRYVDGKPRYDGVREFLASRGLQLPEGRAEDPPGHETVCALGNRKNLYFNQILAQQGTTPDPAAVRFIRDLRAAGLRTAIISASTNAAGVIAAAGAAELFDIRLDGQVAEEFGLRGKPQPDVFLAAAEQLGVLPQRSVVVEAAPAGVQAARAGGFGLVIGINRDGPERERQLAQYAHGVVGDLAEVAVAGLRSTGGLPSALECLGEIARQLRGRRPVVFLDYDGTLTPIVPRPEDAAISLAMRQTVQALAQQCPVAIVSGRDLPDVRRLAGIDGIFYAGSHGFDIAGPAARTLQLQQGTDYLPALERAEHALHERLDGLEGAQVERKKFAIAVHFRRVAEGLQPAVAAAVDAVLEQSQGLRKTGGKKIFELRPDLDWDKGKALRWLLAQLALDGPEFCPFYLGDDLTDEDALVEVQERGIGILVRDEERPTAAAYALENPAEVGSFLQRLAELLQQRGPD